MFMTGLNKQIAVDAAFLPVIHSGDPRAVGLPRDHHDNSMLSCLSSGFLGSLSDSVSQSEDLLPGPGSHHTHTHSLICNVCPYQLYNCVESPFCEFLCVCCRGNISDGKGAGREECGVCPGRLSSGCRQSGSPDQQGVQSDRVFSGLTVCVRSEQMSIKTIYLNNFSIHLNDVLRILMFWVMTPLLILRRNVQLTKYFYVL